jgi:hypothetical protein
MARHHVVERQFRGTTAVLAVIPIPREDLATRQPRLRDRSTDEVLQPNHRGRVVPRSTDAAQLLVANLQYLEQTLSGS